MFKYERSHSVSITRLSVHDQICTPSPDVQLFLLLFFLLPSARVIGVERSVGPEGFTQRTSYLVNQPGLPARQITRTIVIRPNDNRRPNDPNLPPSYDHAVTGRDKSVKVEEGNVGGAPMTSTNQAGATAPPPFTPNVVSGAGGGGGGGATQPSAPPPAPPPMMPPPHVSLVPPSSISGIPPPDYTARASDDSDIVDENRHLLA